MSQRVWNWRRTSSSLPKKKGRYPDEYGDRPGDVGRRRWKKYHPLPPPPQTTTSPSEQQPDPVPIKKQPCSSITFQRDVSDEYLQRFQRIMRCTVYRLTNRGILALGRRLDRGAVHVYLGPDILVEEILIFVGLPHFLILKPLPMP